ncbi:putative spermidine/putrescine transport system permease protein|uniref:Putative spermidine/putrescine transport system permease protein n=1 Tax=Brenneria salicis ATCC 15712 = DSM 30166 TaxID=714314 RepID=A0A366I3Z6_9GAMM|nr:ABC transporter permease [Brenneria salicis]NMN92101.1 putative spermidine/putrescine transport system permease protein [Brenneria salicis ATCC 15712 = DSM 30166]RBP61148.1 putative spermidine/putrescine transport system permease protein [Brenneria salicis ATCC 15712 = DSM 30166]RLM30173.1 ABC transporter permease [Brenneria salicis ATCC 15712 = DSM 30166]
MKLSLSRKNRTLLLLLAPSLLALSAFFVYPLIKMLSFSVYSPEFTWQYYLRIIHEPVWLNVLWITLRTAWWVTLSILLLGYPLAWFLARLTPRIANIFLIIVIIPYFTSVLVRTYAWMVLLGTDGMINCALITLGLVSEPLKLMYTTTGVLIGMTYILLPYMVLALYSVMRGIDPTLLCAAESLGASRLRAFWRVVIPLSLPGAAAGGLLVFIMALGFFITPALMGGPQQTMIAMVIESQIEIYFDWGFGSALSSLLLVFTLLLFWLYQRLVGLERLFEAKR